MTYDVADFLAGLFQERDWLSPDGLLKDWRTAYEERAGIMEYCGNMTRQRAEAEAMKDIRHQIKMEKE